MLGTIVLHYARSRHTAASRPRAASSSSTELLDGELSLRRATVPSRERAATRTARVAISRLGCSGTGAPCLGSISCTGTWAVWFATPANASCSSSAPATARQACSRISILEGTFGEVYPQFARCGRRATAMVREFSWPGGLPSHLTALTPGALHEGGELGYSLGPRVRRRDGQARPARRLYRRGRRSRDRPARGSLAVAPSESGGRRGRAADPALERLQAFGSLVFGAAGSDELGDYFAGLGYEAREVAATTARKCTALGEALDWAHRLGEITHARGKAA